jgi:hypothetical protein
MAKTATVTDLRPAHEAEPVIKSSKKRKPTTKKKTNAEVIAALTPTPAPAPTPAPVIRRPHWGCYPLAAVMVGLLGVSLSHQSEGIGIITHAEPWQRWAMAVSVDTVFVMVEAILNTSTDEIRKRISTIAHVMTVLTLLTSAALNSLAFARDAVTPLEIGGGIYFGCFVSGMLWMSTQLLAHISRR